MHAGSAQETANEKSVGQVVLVIQGEPIRVAMASPRRNSTMTDIKTMDLMAGDGVMESNKVDRFPRTLSTSVLRIKHRSSFWERFWENHRRLA
jgi:hypothetical protein